ncbi:MAG: hypothetical protein NZ777_16440 [Pseudomonadales bacterium]|nr:hypothetical protein [Pseudomonadales bacterium]
MSVFAGIKANKNAKRIARGIEQRGEADARLRQIRAEQLLGQIRDSTVKRGFRSTSATSEDNERQAALLEGADIDRIKFRAAVEAHAARMQGYQALVSSIGDTVSMVMSSVQLGLSVGSYMDSKTALNKTQGSNILSPNQSFQSAPKIFDDVIQLGPRTSQDMSGDLAFREPYWNPTDWYKQWE